MSNTNPVPPPSGYQPSAGFVYTQQPTWTVYSKDVTPAPGNMGAAPGSTPGGVIVRPLRDDQEDAEFAARLVVEAFRGKVVYAVGENNLTAVRKNMAVNHRGQNPAFYNRTFIAEYEGRRAGLLQLKFRGDKEHSSADHLSGIGCCAWFGLCRLGLVIDEDVSRGKCYLDHIAVDDGFRGRGIGKVLLDKAEYEAKLRGCTMIYLGVVTSNRAKNLYERQGYAVESEYSCCGCLKLCLGEPSVYIMEKPLV